MRKDDVTIERPGVPLRRGRPPTGVAKSAAERQREYRERKAAEGLRPLALLLDVEVADALVRFVRRKNADRPNGEPVVTLGDAAAAILRDRLCRKR